MDFTTRLLKTLVHILFVVCLTLVVDSSHEDLRRHHQLRSYGRHSGEQPVAAVDLSESAWLSAHHLQPVVRHIKTRQWRTRVHRRLCAVDTGRSESIEVDSRSECVDLCIDRGADCRAANYVVHVNSSSTCELFHCAPTEFERNVDNCQYIQVSGLRQQMTESSKKARTVIYIGGPAIPNDHVFLRGGVSENRRNTDSTAEIDADIDVTVEGLGDSQYYNIFNIWRQGINKLSWRGVHQPNHGRGVPMVLTSSLPLAAGHQRDNVCGKSYWRIDLTMDCSQTDDGWFEVKGLLANGRREHNITQTEHCNGTAGGRTPYPNSKNHVARCGFVNVFEWNAGSCSINYL